MQYFVFVASPTMGKTICSNVKFAINGIIMTVLDLWGLNKMPKNWISIVWSVSNISHQNRREKFYKNVLNILVKILFSLIIVLLHLHYNHKMNKWNTAAILKSKVKRKNKFPKLNIICKVKEYKNH